VQRAFFFLALVTSGAAVGACAALADLNQFTEGALDAGGSIKQVTRPDVGTSSNDDTNDVPDTGDDVVGPEDSPDEPLGDDATDAGDARDIDDTGSPPKEAGGEDASDGGPAPVDASDGGGADASDGGTGCAHPVTHSNLIPTGQTFTDCEPLNTLNATQAMEACTAANAGCTTNNYVCIGGPTVICTTSTSDPCECWSYSGQTAGHVNKSQNIVCACPAIADPFWN
jgi:hypothetical protein